MPTASVSTPEAEIEGLTGGLEDLHSATLTATDDRSEGAAGDRRLAARHGLAGHGLALSREDLEGPRPTACGPTWPRCWPACSPSFVRFPGGCWVEGDKLTIRLPLEDDHRRRRPSAARSGTSGVPLTNGLGFHEYLQLCEDLGAEPLFVINCGMSHKENVPLEQDGRVGAGRPGRHRVRQRPGRQPVGRRCGPRPAIRHRST